MKSTNGVCSVRWPLSSRRVLASSAWQGDLRTGLRSAQLASLGILFPSPARPLPWHDTTMLVSELTHLGSQF